MVFQVRERCRAAPGVKEIPVKGRGRGVSKHLIITQNNRNEIPFRGHSQYTRMGRRRMRCEDTKYSPVERNRRIHDCHAIRIKPSAHYGCFARENSDFADDSESLRISVGNENRSESHPMKMSHECERSDRQVDHVGLRSKFCQDRTIAFDDSLECTVDIGNSGFENKNKYENERNETSLKYRNNDNWRKGNENDCQVFSKEYHSYPQREYDYKKTDHQRRHFDSDDRKYTEEYERYRFGNISLHDNQHDKKKDNRDEEKKDDRKDDWYSFRKNECETKKHYHNEQRKGDQCERRLQGGYERKQKGRVYDQYEEKILHLPARVENVEKRKHLSDGVKGESFVMDTTSEASGQLDMFEDDEHVKRKRKKEHIGDKSLSDDNSSLDICRRTSTSKCNTSNSVKMKCDPFESSFRSTDEKHGMNTVNVQTLKPLKSILKKKKEHSVETDVKKDLSEWVEPVHIGEFNFQSPLYQNFQKAKVDTVDTVPVMQSEMNIDDEEEFLYGQRNLETPHQVKVLEHPFLKVSSYDGERSSHTLISRDSGKNVSSLPSWMRPLEQTESGNIQNVDSMDQTVQNILKSIGFNFDLSKRMQELAKMKKRKEEDSQFLINQNASFLGADIPSVDLKAELFNGTQKTLQEGHIQDSEDRHVFDDMQEIGHLLTQSGLSRIKGESNFKRGSSANLLKGTFQDFVSKDHVNLKRKNQPKYNEQHVPKNQENTKRHLPKWYSNTLPEAARAESQSNTGYFDYPSVTLSSDNLVPLSNDMNSTVKETVYSKEREKSPEYSRIVIAPKIKQKCDESHHQNEKLPKQIELTEKKVNKTVDMIKGYKPTTEENQRTSNMEDFIPQMSLKESEERKRKLLLLEKELEKLKKHQNEIMRRRQRQRDGHKDPLLLQNSKLQEEITAQIKLLRKASDSSDDFGPQPAKKAYIFSSSTYKKEYVKTKTEELSLPQEFYDPGYHWCSSCNCVSKTLLDHLIHLQSREHKQRKDPIDQPCLKKYLQKTDLPSISDSKEATSLKGVEFIVSTQAFYCTLCDLFTGDLSSAEAHLVSGGHFQKYQNHIEQNEFYEKRYNLEKASAISQLTGNLFLRKGLNNETAKAEVDEEKIKAKMHEHQYSKETLQNKEESSCCFYNMKQERKIPVIGQGEAIVECKPEEEKAVEHLQGNKLFTGHNTLSVAITSENKTEIMPHDSNLPTKIGTKREKEDDYEIKLENTGIGTKRGKEDDYEIKLENTKQEEYPRGKIAIRLTGKTGIKPHVKVLPAWTPVAMKPDMNKAKMKLEIPTQMKPVCNLESGHLPSLDRFLLIGGATRKKLPVYKLRSGTVKKQVCQIPKITPMVPEEIEDMKLLGIESDSSPEIAQKKVPPPRSQNMSLPKDGSSKSSSSAEQLYTVFFQNPTNSVEEKCVDLDDIPFPPPLQLPAGKLSSMQVSSLSKVVVDSKCLKENRDSLMVETSIVEKNRVNVEISEKESIFEIQEDKGTNHGSNLVVNKAVHENIDKKTTREKGLSHTVGQGIAVGNLEIESIIDQNSYGFQATGVKIIGKDNDKYVADEKDTSFSNANRHQGSCESSGVCNSVTSLKMCSGSSKFTERESIDIENDDLKVCEKESRPLNNFIDMEKIMSDVEESEKGNGETLHLDSDFEVVDEYEAE